MLFTYEVGRNRQSAISNAELYRRITGIDVKDDKTFTMHFDKLTFDYAAINDFVVLPAHIERPAFADPAQYRVQTRYATDPTNPGLYNGPYRISEVATGLAYRARAEPALGRARRSRSAALRCARSRTPPRSKPICCPARST